LPEFEPDEVKGKMAYRSAVFIHFNRKKIRMSSVGFGTQLKNTTIFHCNIPYVYNPAKYKSGKKKTRSRGKDDIEIQYDMFKNLVTKIYYTSGQLLSL
jgi:hypothetical protein